MWMYRRSHDGLYTHARDYKTHLAHIEVNTCTCMVVGWAMMDCTDMCDIAQPVDASLVMYCTYRVTSVH